MSKIIQLYCPSNKRTVETFVISPFQTNEQILQGIRLALNLSWAVLYTVDAKHITKLDTIQEGQRVLVAASQGERMLPDAPFDFEFYNGQEGEDLDPDLNYAQPWDSLSERDKCDHIHSLTEMKPATRNKLRITRQWQSVLTELTALEEATPETRTLHFDPAECEALIEQRWRVTLDHALPESMKPEKWKVAGGIWDESVLAALAILSSLTPGQVRLTGEFLEEAVRLRVTNGNDTSTIVQLQDVINAVTIIYERAGVIAAKLTKPKTAKAREKEKRKALKEKKKSDAKGRGRASMGGEE